jgi:hypothetical protein
MVWLAAHLYRNLNGTPDLAWWQLPLSRSHAVASGLVDAPEDGHGVWRRLQTLQMQRAPTRGLRWSPGQLVGGLRVGLVFGLVLGLDLQRRLTDRGRLSPLTVRRAASWGRAGGCPRRASPLGSQGRPTVRRRIRVKQPPRVASEKRNRRS